MRWCSILCLFISSCWRLYLLYDLKLILYIDITLDLMNLYINSKIPSHSSTLSLTIFTLQNAFFFLVLIVIVFVNSVSIIIIIIITVNVSIDSFWLLFVVASVEIFVSSSIIIVNVVGITCSFCLLVVVASVWNCLFFFHLTV